MLQVLKFKVCTQILIVLHWPFKRSQDLKSPLWIDLINILLLRLASEVWRLPLLWLFFFYCYFGMGGIDIGAVENRISPSVIVRDIDIKIFLFQELFCSTPWLLLCLLLSVLLMLLLKWLWHTTLSIECTITSLSNKFGDSLTHHYIKPYSQNF